MLLDSLNETFGLWTLKATVVYVRDADGFRDQNIFNT